MADISLQWMINQLEELPHKPVFNESRLHCDPDPLAPQHCAVKAVKFKYPLWWPKAARFSWPAHDREVPKDAPLHPSVIERYRAEAVLQEGVNKPYRPNNLKGHQQLVGLTSAQATDQEIPVLAVTEE